jgi:hypothetical protein
MLSGGPAVTPLCARPEVAGFVAAVRAGGGAEVGVFLDWLDDRRATAADVCTLYGVPPPWPGARRVQLFVTELDAASSRGDRLALAAQQVEAALSKDGFRPGPVRSDFDTRQRAWRLTGDSTPPPPAEDDSLRPVLAAWADRHGPPGRGAGVRAPRVEEYNDGGLSFWYVGPAADPLRDAERHLTPARAARALKRRVLGLWSEVRVPCPACGGSGFDGEEPDHEEHMLGYSTYNRVKCVPCLGSGTVAPAGLIPPEEPTRPRNPLRPTDAAYTYGAVRRTVHEFTARGGADVSFGGVHLGRTPPEDAP